MNEIKWVTMKNRPQTLIMMGLKHGLDGAANMKQDALVDAINRKIAKANKTVVPMELVLIQKPVQTSGKSETKQAKPATPKADKEVKPQQPRERKPSGPKVNNNTPEKYGFKAGEDVVLLGREVSGKMILVGRKMRVSGASPNEGMLLGFLVKEGDGSLQKSEITIPVECIQGYQKLEAAQ